MEISFRHFLQRHAMLFALAFLVIAASFTWRVALARSGELTVHVLNVGQGDAIFFSLPDGTQALIDGGPDASVLGELSEVMPPWDSSLDLVILTHPDADHLAGLLDVLDRYDVAVIVETGIRKETALSKSWDEAVLREGARVLVVDRPQRIKFGDVAALDLLWPQALRAGEMLDKPNEYAVVSRLVYGEISLLLTADIERWTEGQLVATVPEDLLQSDILKAAHHGSKTSSSEIFLNAVDPEVALISVGEGNRYGHPHASVLARFAQLGIPLVRTDEAGRITIHSDGRIFSVDKEY